MSDDDPTIEEMRNLGPKCRAMLAPLGIHRRSDVERWGAIGVFLRVRQGGLKPSLNLLYALEGALRDRDWRELSAADKERLLSQLESEND